MTPSAATRRLATIPHDAMHLTLMLSLTFSTGIIDAVGYLGLDRVFTGNMTGNVVVLGMALVGGNGLPVLGPFLALAGFMAGAALGGRVLKAASPGWSHRTTALFSLVAIAMLALAVLLFCIEDDLPHAVGVGITTTLGVAMGVQAATARFIAVKDVTTVVVTSTITGLAADSMFGSGLSRSGAGGSTRRALAVVLILCGAIAGAGLLKWHLGAGLVLAAAVTGTVTVVGALHARHAAALVG
jgi:uncharacterized membrane protein YoaK (UPF0700 family)